MPTMTTADRLEKLRNEYRPTMDSEVLHHWAQELTSALATEQARVEQAFHTLGEKIRSIHQTPVGTANGEHLADGRTEGIREAIQLIRGC